MRADTGALATRREFLRQASALVVTAPPLAALLSGCGGMDDGMPEGMMEEGMPGWMMSPGQMDARMMRDMRVIHELLLRHEEIERQVDDVRGGIRALTTSETPEVADLIRTHVRQMKERIEDGDAIRHMDPLFREIFKHHEEIEIEVEGVTGGVRVVETSADPQVVLLIRQHARRAVSEFVAAGMRRAMRPTPLLRGYHG